MVSTGEPNSIEGEFQPGRQITMAFTALRPTAFIRREKAGLYVKVIVCGSYPVYIEWEITCH